MPAHPVLSVGDHRFEAGQLQFLLQGSHAQVYAALLLEEQRYRLAIGLIQERSELVLNEVFPRMAKAGFTIGAASTQEDIERALGVDLVHKLKEMAAALYKNVDEDLISLRVRHDEVRNAIKQLYPKQKVLQVVFGASAA